MDGVHPQRSATAGSTSHPNSFTLHRAWAHSISPLTSKASNLWGRKAHVNLVIPRLGFFKLDAQVDLTQDLGDLFTL
jgi:hypothetical protein